MSLASEAITDPIDLKSHPVLTPALCLNRRQRRYPCTRCADLCPHDVYPVHSGEAIRWAQCSDCSLCVSACPARVIAPSAQNRRAYVDNADASGPVRVTCRREETFGDLRASCISALPWELLAVFALRTGLILCLRTCPSCDDPKKKQLLEENLKQLKDFLGEERFAQQVCLVRPGDDIPSSQEAPFESSPVTRRELFSGMRKSVMKQLVRQAEKRMPLPDEEDTDGMQYRRLLFEAVSKERAAALSEQKTQDAEHLPQYGVQLPRFNTACFGCGICETVCPHKVLTFSPEEDGSRMIWIEPWKCSGCSLCVKLCPYKGLDCLELVSVPHLGKLPLVRVKSSSCERCDAVILPGTDPPLCRRCSAAGSRKGHR